MAKSIGNESAEKFGQILIDVLQLEVKNRSPGKGRVSTTWGDKNPEGLGKVVYRILHEQIMGEEVVERDEQAHAALLPILPAEQNELSQIIERKGHLELLKEWRTVTNRLLRVISEN